MRLKLRLIRKSRKAFDTATIVRLLHHEDEHGMGRIFMYAFVNEVVRMKTPFPFDCESAQVLENDDGLLVVDKEDRSIAIKHKFQRLGLSLDDKRAEGIKQIKYKGRCYRDVMLAWLAVCIRYTSLQPELREELMRYVRSIKRTTISESKKSNLQNLRIPFFETKSNVKNLHIARVCVVIWHIIFVYLQRKIHHTHGKSNRHIPNRQWSDCH